ncbi:MAG: S24/S26 family peptidase [Thermodesulfobacteriota bacterium]|nr:S24/S26 family peptidase [Thermodesulfobacteriota bacterium]
MRLYKVKGNSMYPFLRDNDLIAVRRITFERLRKGNLLVFKNKEGEYIIHRLVKKTGKIFVCLRGDGYNLKAELVEMNSIAGKAIGIIRKGRFIRFNRTMELCSWSVSRFKEYLKRFLRGDIANHGSRRCLLANLHNSQNEGGNLS